MGLPLQPVHRNDPLSRNSDPSELQELRGEPAVGAGGCGLNPLTTQFHCSNVWNLRNVNIIYIYMRYLNSAYHRPLNCLNFLLRSPNSPGFSPGAVARCDGAWHRRRKSSNWKTVARSPWIGGTLPRPIEDPVPANSDSFLLTNLDLVKTTVYGDMTKTRNIYISDYIWLYMTILHWV
jgi:hypothetical protein